MIAPLVAALFVLLAGICVALALWVNRVGRGRSASLFVVVLAIDTVWLLAAGAYMVAHYHDLMVLLLHLRTVLSILSGLLFFVFALAYTGRDHWLTRRFQATLGAIGLCFVAVVISNPWTNWIMQEMTLVREPVRHTSVEAGPLTGPLFLASITFTLAAIAMLGSLFFQSRRATRNQSALLILAVLIPIVLIIGQILFLVPYPMLPYTPLGIGLFAILSGIAMFRNQLFVAEPVARSAVVEQIQDPVFVTRDDEILVDHNQAAEAQFGPLVIGDSLREHVPSLYRDPGSGTVVTELTIQDGDMERTYSVERSILEEHTRSGGAAIVCRDITARTQYERQLQDQTEQFEQIAGTISHDLRNPLSVASAHVDLAMETGDLSSMDDVQRALQRMDTIISDVLVLSREGQQVVNPAPVSVGELAQAAWDTSATDAATLTMEASGTIEADADRLQRLFENLFRNAVDHGGSDVTVWVGFDGNELYIEDNGPGVPPEEREKIFEHGYTTDSENTGFGLDIVRSIATAHGWQVSVESGREGGARFVFQGIDRAIEA